MTTTSATLISSQKIVEEVENVQKSRAWTAYIFILIGAVCSALSNFSLKLSGPEEKAMFVLIRCGMQYLILYPYICFTKMEMIESSTLTVFLLCVRGLTGSLGMFSLALSLNYLSLGDAIAIFYTFPVLVGLFGWLCLKEKCGKLSFLLTILAVVGTVFITQPPFLFGNSSDADQFPFSVRLYGVLLAAFASTVSAICFVVVRKLGPEVHFSKSVFYFSWIGVLFSSIYIAVSRQSFLTCFQSLPLLVGGSFLLFLAQCFMTLAYQREIAGRVALVQTTEVPIAFLLEYFVLGTSPTIYGIIGAALVLLSFILLAVKSIIKTARYK